MNCCILNVMNWHFYFHITYSLKVSDDTTIEFVKSTEWPPNSAHLNPLYLHVWKDNIEMDLR
jgi:hypothetical protein